MNNRIFEHPDSYRENVELRSIRWVIHYPVFVILNSLVLPIAIGMFCCSITFSQTSKIDSLQNLLKTNIADTTKVNTLNALFVEYISTVPDSALLFAEQALALAKTVTLSGVEGWQKGAGNAHHSMGHYYFIQGDYPKCLEHWLKALAIRKSLSESGSEASAKEARKGISASHGNIGNVYYSQGDYPKALEYYFKALKMDEEMGNRTEIAIKTGNIGLLYSNQGDYPKALEYYFKALKIAKEIGDKNRIAIMLGNIGVVYWNQGDYPKALEYYFKALKIAEEIGDKNLIAIWLGNIGVVYKNQGDSAVAAGDTVLAMADTYPKALASSADRVSPSALAVAQAFYAKALEYYFKALKMDEELGNKNGIARHLGNIGSLYISTKEYAKAEEYLLRALEIAEEIGALNEERQFEEIISNLYAQTNRYRLACEHHKAYGMAKDSLFNEEKSKDLGKLEAKHEFETAEIERKRIEEEQAKQAAAARSRRDNLQYSGILIFIVFLGAGLFAISVRPLEAVRPIYLRLAEGMIFFTFLLFFEFTLVLLDPYIEQYSSGAPAVKLGFNAVLAGLIFPLHSFFETKLKKRITSRTKDE